MTSVGVRPRRTRAFLLAALMLLAVFVALAPQAAAHDQNCRTTVHTVLWTYHEGCDPYADPMPGCIFKFDYRFIWVYVGC